MYVVINPQRGCSNRFCCFCFGFHCSFLCYDLSNDFSSNGLMHP